MTGPVHVLIRGDIFERFLFRKKIKTADIFFWKSYPACKELIDVTFNATDVRECC